MSSFTKQCNYKFTLKYDKKKKKTCTEMKIYNFLRISHLNED